MGVLTSNVVEHARLQFYLWRLGGMLQAFSNAHIG